MPCPSGASATVSPSRAPPRLISATGYPRRWPTAAGAARGRPATGPPSTWNDLVLAAVGKALRDVTWRCGSKAHPDNPTAAMRSRFAALRIRPANRDIPRAEDGTLPEAWLLAEWPTDADERTDLWLSTLPADTPLEELVRLAKISLAYRARLPRIENGSRTGSFRGPFLAGLASPRNPGYRRTSVPHHLAVDRPKATGKD